MSITERNSDVKNVTLNSANFMVAGLLVINILIPQFSFLKRDSSKLFFIDKIKSNRPESVKTTYFLKSNKVYFPFNDYFYFSSWLYFCFPLLKNTHFISSKKIVPCVLFLKIVTLKSNQTPNMI